MIMLDRLFTAFATRVASIVGQPVAFVVAFLVVLVWAISGPLFGFSDTWQLVINTGTTIVTFLIVFLIQNSQNRDAAAMQAKLDELLRAVDKARGAFIGIEHLTDQQIEEVRAALEREAGSRGTKAKAKANLKVKGKTADESVEQLLKRF
jgi:low affinity Fe/Cu permease